jgi:hypothetical protein
MGPEIVAACWKAVEKGDVTEVNNDAGLTIEAVSV